jgi:hypothetical protein
MANEYDFKHRMASLGRVSTGRTAVIKRVYWRIYQDFLMHARLREYEKLLTEAKERGYATLTLCDLATCVSRQATLPPLTLVLRNDVDSDVATAREMFQVEKTLGIKATYYFRLSTLDAALMRDMQDYGTEVGYHFEEVATVAKRRGLRSSADVESHLDLIRERFRRNVQYYRTVAGSFPRTVASHGDFANRAINTTNSCIIDQKIRTEFGIVAEAYDEWLNAPVTMRLADCDAPKWWSPMPLSDALKKNPKCLYVLVHPRQWRANAWENAKAETIRIAEGAFLRVTQKCLHSHG